MAISPRALLTIGLPLGWCFASSSPLLAKSLNLKPQTFPVHSSTDDFEKCKVDVLETWKKSDDKSRDSLRRGIGFCRDMHASSVNYRDCKKESLTKNRTDRAALKESILQCKRELRAQTFDGRSNTPFWLDDQNRLYFAGIGMNYPLPFKLPDPPHYSCETLRKANDDPALRSYFLVGNLLNLFAGFDDKDPKKIIAMWGVKTNRKNTDFIDLKGFGRVFREKAGGPLVYFPMSQCSYAADPSPLYEGLQIYYLQDDVGQQVIPYFGLAFFAKAAPPENIQAMADRLSQKLGIGYKATLNPSQDLYVISREPVTEWDVEGDPKNLCRSPRPHQWLGIVKVDPEQPERASYFLLASIKNLCDYGDRLASRIKQEL